MNIKAYRGYFNSYKALPKASRDYVRSIKHRSPIDQYILRNMAIEREAYELGYEQALKDHLNYNEGE